MNRFLNRAARAGILVAAIASLAACSSGVQFVREDMTRYPAKSKDAPIEVHEGNTLKPYVVIGTLTADRRMEATGESTYDLVVDDLTQEARKVGADALIHVRPVDNTEMSTRVMVTATAVRFMRQGATVTSAGS